MVVSDRDCALAVGVPLDRGRFFSDLRRGSDKDFVKSHRRRFPGHGAARLWAEVYARGAVGLRRTCREIASAAEAGLVLTDVDPQSLGDLARKWPVVTLFAHWCPAPFVETDIRDLPSLRRRLDSVASLNDSLCDVSFEYPVERYLTKNLQPRDLSNPRCLAQALNRLTHCGGAPESGGLRAYVSKGREH